VTEPQPVTGEEPLLLEATGLTKRYAGTVALDNVDFDLRAGEIHCLVGENGAGKSTLIKIIAGAVRQDSGRISVSGRDVTHSNLRERRDLGVTVVYQDLNLVPEMSVAENIFLGHEPRTRRGTLDKKRIHREAEQLIDRLGAPFPVRSRVSDIGVSLQQLTATARALSLNGRIMIMDEPSAVLVGKELDLLFSMIKHLKEQGFGIIYISHRLEEIFQIGDRVTVLRDGKHVSTEPVGGLSTSRLIQMMVGRELGELHRRTGPSRIGDEALRVDGLGRDGVLNDVSFTVHAGEVVGIAGLVGAGRTELARAIMGLDPHDTGTIHFLGKPVQIRGPAQAVRIGLSLAPEDRRADGLVSLLSVRDNGALSILPRMSRFTFVRFGALYKRIARLCLDMTVKVRDLREPVSSLSGGNQQKVVLVRCLATDCRVLILDEPTAGVDVAAKRDIHALIVGLTQRGVGVVYISAELPEILAISDRILVMAGGRITGELDPVTTTQEEILGLAIPPMLELAALKTPGAA
jgi:ribose transport system ATP-binding protein